MTNPNPVSPTTIMTENYILEKLDIIGRQFSGSSNHQQAVRDEERLLREFIRALTIPGGVRKVQDCALALVESARFINI